MANERTENKEKIRIDYTKCNMTKKEHILTYLMWFAILFVIVYIYYRNVIPAAVIALLAAKYQEKNWRKVVTKKRQSKLRVQFKEFLEIISISVSGGSGRSIENAIVDSLRELQMIYSGKADIIHEIGLIVHDYQRAGVPMSQGFSEFAQRSGIDDIKSFATIYATIEGKSSDFGYIIKNTKDIIKEKIEITQEIETCITGAKNEAYTMLVMPLIILLMMSGNEGMDSLFTTFMGKAVATAGLIILAVSYLIASRATDVEV